MDPRAEDFDAHEFLEHQVDAAPSIHTASRARGRGRRKYRSASRNRSASPVERGSRHTKGRIGSRSRSPVRGNRAGRYENRHITEEERRKRDREKLERDARTVFAYSITKKADERDIFDFFSQAGKVVDVRIITDRHTGKSKGLAYVELAQPADVRKALDLNGRRLLDQPVLVKPSEAEKNFSWGGGRGAPPMPPHPRAFMPPFLANLPPPPFPPGYANPPSNVGECRVLVNNLPLSMNELELKALFDPFGEVVLALLERDAATGKSKGSGFVQFKNTMFAARAIQQLNGLIVAGSRIGVRMGAIFPVAPVPVEPGLTENLDLALEGNEGLKLSSQARVALMSRLARGDPTLVSRPSAKSPPQSEDKVSASVIDHLDQGFLGPSSPIPTPCLLLKNMFDPEQEEGEGWDKEIEEDVRLECEKFGRLEHIFIDKSSKGHVYLKFFDVKAAEQAQARLHGRWFAGKQVVAVYQFLKTYNKRFLPEVVEGQQ